MFRWLQTLYPIWARMTADDIFVSTPTALAELALSIDAGKVTVEARLLEAASET